MSPDDRRIAALAGELGLSVDEFNAAMADVTPGVPDAVVGGLIRFEDALFELSQ